MPRLTQLDDVLFPVEEHPVYVSLPGVSGERRVAVPDKKAIVNRNNDRVLGVVSRAYRLVTNHEALELAYACCRTVFPETQPGEWSANAVDAPSTAGYCHIDLVHNSTALDFAFVPAEDRPDAFGPFIRVTNSYNGLRALGFDIGYFRKVCKNGLIVPDTIIRFKYSHMRSEISDTMQFEVAKERLARFRGVFTDSLAGLRKCVVARPQFEPLICGVLQLRRPEPASRDEADWPAIGTHLSAMSDRYAEELGENAYAVFNAITDFASRPLENRCVHRDRNSLQRLAGTWLTAFNQVSREQTFSLTRYLEELAAASAGASGAGTSPGKPSADPRGRGVSLETVVPELDLAMVTGVGGVDIDETLQ